MYGKCGYISKIFTQQLAEYGESFGSVVAFRKASPNENSSCRCLSEVQGRTFSTKCGHNSRCSPQSLYSSVEALPPHHQEPSADFL